MVEADFRLLELARAAKSRILNEKNKPLTVAILGQTGVGKTSLINSLFGTDFATDAVRPCTMELQKHTVRNRKGHELHFVDLPGIGESSSADARYMEQYREVAASSDVVIWALHADMRSVTFDVDNIRLVLGDEPGLRKLLLAKLVFVMTKADLLTPEPWLLLDMQDHAVFAAHPKINELLDSKCHYLTDSMITPYGDDLSSSTYHEGLSSAEELEVGEHVVTYQGLVTEQVVKRLKHKHPDHEPVFDRLLDNHLVIPCSARFRFNLGRLMLVIMNKLGKEATLRFKSFLDPEKLVQLSADNAVNYFNIQVLDPKGGKILLDPRDKSSWPIQASA